jgi:hypothetical protein
MNYEEQVRTVYPIKSDIDCSFYWNKYGKENLWHVDVVDYDEKRMVCIGKGLFKNVAWKNAYENLKKQGKL